MTYAMFLSSHRLVKVLEIMAALALTLALVKPRAGAAWFAAVEKRLHWAATHPRVGFSLAVAFPLIARAVMLPWFPPPNPIVHDEFSYLLQADTFAQGRVTNPTPAEPRHYETEYTLLTPTYASQYQPAGGLMLALGQVLFSHPWWGVWISVGLMCGTLYWALGTVMPAAWALFGACVAALQFGIFGIWMNSYFGGAVSATAGAIVFGSLASLRDRRHWLRTAILCGLGLILLFATRPLEGVIWSAVTIVYGAFSLRGLSGTMPRLIGPFAVVCLAGAGLLAWYNWRITGSAATPPYLAYRQVYGTPQPYWWQRPVVIDHFDYPEIRDNYLNQVRLYDARYSLSAMLGAERDRLRDFWRFFVGPFLTPALLFLGFLARDRRIRPWLWISALFIADKATYHAWFPAQNGPATVLIVLVLVQCWRHLRSWQRERSFGLAASRSLMAAFCAAVFLGGIGRAAEPILPASFRHIVPIWESLYPPKRLRDDVTRILEKTPGQHLLFVKYAPGHCFCEEWVFNGAEPKSQRVVYLRPDTPRSDAAIVRDFPGFDVWVVEPDAHPYVLQRVTADQIAGLSVPVPVRSNDLFDSD